MPRPCHGAVYGSGEHLGCCLERPISKHTYEATNWNKQRWSLGQVAMSFKGTSPHHARHPPIYSVQRAAQQRSRVLWHKEKSWPLPSPRFAIIRPLNWDESMALSSDSDAGRLWASDVGLYGLFLIISLILVVAPHRRFKLCSIYAGFYCSFRIVGDSMRLAAGDSTSQPSEYTSLQTGMQVFLDVGLSSPLVLLPTFGCLIEL